ncbi:alpha-2-macroglobulin family protein [Bordetella hinzii]|nr:alpha-2-macroglobulin family protein [Bordetella hinzii]QWF42898.1 alpha-2-macroglobulin family protein [Bordetella hinzii]QWF47439.1 alpha-2-macroglobulin family protein [Bordetella hinzii]QWF51974.1 alpha-2-macroglobulin family protein [Bordetella hinzii]QWF56511.1 alpha-2-macroglobulin family protein [Bordetella hinzii]
MRCALANKKKVWLGVGGAVILAAAVGLGWLAGRGPAPQSVSPQAARQAEQSVIAAAEQAASPGAPAAKPAGQATVGKPDPFAALNCQPRQYNDSLALALTFTQPVDRKADLGRYLQVTELGEAPQGADDSAGSGQSQASTGQAAPKGRAVQGGWVVGDNPRVVYFPYVQPLKRYAISVREGLPGGESVGALPEAARCDVATQAMPPSFYFASRGVVLPAGQNGGLPVATVNMPEVDVQFLRVDPQRVPEFFDTVLGIGRKSGASEDDDEGPEEDDWRYADNRSLKGSVSNWDLDRLNTLTTSVYQGRFVTDDKPNRRHVTFLPVEHIKELQDPGIYIAVMSQPGRFRYEYQTTYFYVSDIGLHARRYPDRSEAYAVSLKTGQPLSGVRVELVDGAGKSLAQADADAQGHVRFDGSHANARVMRATRGKEMTLLALGEPALDLSEYDIGGHPARNNNLFVYAGRNLYRPGEQFHVSVLARDPDGRPLPASPLTATIKRPDGRVTRTTLWHPAKDLPNYVEQVIDIPQDAQTGTWMLELRVDPAARIPDASWKFQVEEFLPERMKLALTSEQPVLAPDETWQVALQGDYLYGAPAAGNRVLASFQVKRDRIALPGQWPGFVFGDVADDTLRRFEELPDSELDERGHGEISVDPQAGEARSPLKVRLSVSLLESGGRPVVRSIERSVWPADTLIGLRPLFDRDVAREGAPAGFEIIRVNAEGKPQPVNGAQVRLYREERQYYWRFDDQRGWNSGYTETEELTDSRVIDIGERASLTVDVKWGRYRLEIADPQTGQVARYRFYAGWNAQDADAVGNRPDRVQLKLQDLPAKPGGKVRMTVVPPHDGQALITVEGDRMLWSQWLAVKATGTEVEIPVDAAWKRHDLYVSATVFRPGSEGDRVTPARALGLAYLPLASAERKLAVSLSAAAKVEPEKPATVRVKVDGASGGKAYVTLSAVDVGILNINQYATPDPMDFFFGKHRYAPELLDMYGKLIEKMDGTQGRLKWGGDAAMRGDSRSLPKKVKLVDLFSGVVALNAQGEAEIKLDVPDFNGTLRLMAVAFSAERYGSAETEMMVAAPVVAELNTPRFITPGDQAAVALDLTNLSGATRKLTVKLQALDPLAIADSTRTVTLKDKERATLRFVATTTGSYGLGLMRLVVQGDGLDITRESVLQVQPAYAAERRARRIRLNPGEEWTPPADLLANWHADSVTASMTLSNRPPLNVNRLVQGLLNYPYGCTEQTISATLPWVIIDEAAAKRFGMTPRTLAERQAKIDGALARLSGMRGATGAYSLWGDYSSRDVWLTAYALGFMQDARDRGFNVPDSGLERTRQWLLEQLQQTPNNFGTWSANLRKGLESGRFDSSSAEVLRNDHRRFAGLAAAALALARDGKAPLSTVRQLFDNYGERARSPLPLIQLAAAFKLLGDEGRMKTALEQGMTRAYGITRRGSGYYDEWLGDYGSSVRDYAQAYALLNQYGLRDARSENLLEQAAARMGNRSYLSTQEQMALLLAANSAGGDRAAPWQAMLQQAGTSRNLSSPQDQTLEIGPAELAATRLRNTGNQSLFVEFDAQGTPRTAPAPRNDVIGLQRGWYRPDGSAWDGGLLQTGDMLVVWIQADATQYVPDALIVDRVPAGFEVENLNLSQSPEMQDWQIGGRRVAEAMANPNIKHREFRDDRYVAAATLGRGKVDIFYLARVVSPGRYSVPSVVAEDMYRPELRGVGDTWSSIEIRDRQPRK